MKRLLFLMLLPVFVQAANLTPPDATKFDFQAVSVSQVVNLVYLEALKQSYVIAPEMLQDQRQVSFRFDSNKGDLKTFWRNFLNVLGYSIDQKNGVDFITKTPESQPQIEKELEQFDFVYTPKNRSADYLNSMLRPLVAGLVATRSIPASPDAKGTKTAPPNSAGALIDQTSDLVVFRGSQNEVERIKRLLPQLDIAMGEIVVRGAVYEVSTTQKDGSAFSLALGLLNNQLSINLGSTKLDNSISFKSGSFDAVLSALDNDARFKVVSSPRLRVRSGSHAKLTVGQEVPTLAGVSYSPNSTEPVKNVVYRNSGVIFDLSPIVRAGSIDLSVTQELSNFVTTTTGVNESPTLTKRTLETATTLNDGEIVVIGGLTEEKDNNTKTGFSFLPSWASSKLKEKTNSEILMVLQVNKI